MTNKLYPFKVFQKDCHEYIYHGEMDAKISEQYLYSINGRKFWAGILNVTASVETISERIKSDSGRDQKLALGRLQENIAFLEQNYPEAMCIDTERKSISEICDIILSKCTVQE